MSETEANIDAIYDRIQDEFDHVDGKIGSHGKRRLAISEVPQLARDLYLVHDIVAITCNAGISAWIHYHHAEPGWLKCAADAFIRIGHPEIARDIDRCAAIYLIKKDAMDYEDDEVFSRGIWDHEHEIMRSLYEYLLANSFVFLNREA